MGVWKYRFSGITLGLSLTVLLFDFHGVFGGRIWLTSGRVSHPYIPGFVFSNIFLLDGLIVYLLEVVVLVVAWSERLGILRYLLMGILFCVPLSILASSSILLYSFLIIFTGLLVLAFHWVPGGLRGFLQGVLLFTGGLGFLGVLEVLVWLVSGERLGNGLPVLLVLVSNYTVWSLTPLLVLATGLLGGVVLFVPEWRERFTRVIGFERVEDCRDACGRRVFYLVPLAMLLGFLVMVIPYLPTVNPGGKPVTVDWVYYYGWLRDVDAIGLGSVLRLHMDRPLYIILLYGLVRVFHVDPLWIAVYQIFFISQLYVLASYYLGWSLGGWRTGVYSAFLSVVSPMFLSFQYGGFQSDFFTVSIVYFALGLIARAESGRRLLLGFLVFDLAMFLHEWTWTQYILVLSLYAVVMAVREYRGGGVSGRSKLLLGLIVLSVLVDVAKSPLGVRWPSSIVGVTNASRNMYLHKSSVASNWFLTTIYTGGSLNNPLFYLVALLGSVFSGPLLAAALFSGLLPFPLLHYVITYRVLVNTPLQVPGGLLASRLGRLEFVLLYVALLSLAVVFVATITYTPLF